MMARFYRRDSVMIIDRLQTKESPGSFLSAIMAEAGLAFNKIKAGSETLVSMS